MYPPEVTSKNMLQAIAEFANDNADTRMTIYICVHKKEDSLKKNLQVCWKMWQYTKKPNIYETDVLRPNKKYLCLE